jgi:hypothetical protein
MGPHEGEFENGASAIRVVIRAHADDLDSDDSRRCSRGSFGLSWRRTSSARGALARFPATINQCVNKPTFKRHTLGFLPKEGTNLTWKPLQRKQ